MSFQYKLKLHYQRPTDLQGKRFRKFSSALIRQPMPKVTQFMEIQQPTFEEVDKFRMKFFWKKPAFKFPRFEECLLGLTLTRGNGTRLDTPLDSYTTKQEEHVLILERCKVRKISLTYLFKGDYPELKIKSAPNFCPPLKLSMVQGGDKTLNDSVAFDKGDLKIGTIWDQTEIVVIFALSLILPTIVIGTLVLKWRTRNMKLTKRSRFQNKERKTGEIQHITYEEARSIEYQTEEEEERGVEKSSEGDRNGSGLSLSIEEKDKSSSSSGSNNQDAEIREESTSAIFLELEVDSDVENKIVDNGLRYSIGDNGTTLFPPSSPSYSSHSLPSSSLSSSSNYIVPPPPPSSPPPVFL